MRASSRGLQPRAAPLQRAAPRRPRSAATEAPPSVKGDIIEFEAQRWHRMEASPSAPPIVVLPGFGNDSSDYEAPFGDADSPSCLVTALKRRGFRPYVVQLRRREWFRVARAALTSRYWSGRLTVDPGYTWYLEKVAEAVDLARRETGSDQVDLVGHSAGGWLGRAFIGAERFKPGCSPDGRRGAASSDFEPHSSVRSLVTLGTPHRPPAAGSQVRDVTGGALPWVDFMWPGAFFDYAGVKYVSVAGRAVRGNRDADKESPSCYAAASYQQVCGEGHGVEGDAVVPLSTALLPGARQLTLDGVRHSMSRLRTFKEPSADPWYGCDAVVDSWLAELV